MLRAMDKLRAMHTFVTIVDEGSLTAAARALGSSLPAVVRLLAALEKELGARLLQRTTRRLTLSEAGRRYLERCREVLGLVNEAEGELRAEQTEPQGKLRVTAPVLFGTRHVAAGITAFIQRYPAVSVDALLLDRVVNLVEEGIDVGVRIGSLDDSSLIARPVASMRRLTVAAPSYLARRGTPQHPRDLAGHDCIRFAHQVAPELASGALRVLLARFEPPAEPVQLVYPEARLLPARTRAFVALMREHLERERGVWELAGAKPGRPPRARPK